MYNQFPYYNFNPNAFSNATNAINSNGLGSILSFSKKNFNWDSFLNNAQRTLNVINQAMPIYNQVRPMFRNMGTIFKVIGELNSSALPASAVASQATTSAIAASTPQFFV